MDVVNATGHPRTHQPNRQLAGARILLRSAAGSLAIAPAGIRDLSTIGRRSVGGSRIRRTARGVISLPLGAVAWMLAALVGLMVARGALYGLVDAGPYDNAWGGPTLAGAWLTHFAISVPSIIAALLAMAGIARLHVRLSRWAGGERLGWWPMPVALLISGAAVVFFTGWLQQI